MLLAGLLAASVAACTDSESSSSTPQSSTTFKTALKNSVLKSYHNIVVFLEVFKHILVNARDIVGIYKSGSCACFFFD